MAVRKLAPITANTQAISSRFTIAVGSNIACDWDQSLLDHDTARLTQYIQLCDVAAVHKRCNYNMHVNV